MKTSTRSVIVFPLTGELQVSCPLCRQMIVRTLSDELVAVLVAGGARVRKVLPPLTVDDLLDFHERFDEEIKELLA